MRGPRIAIALLVTTGGLAGCGGPVRDLTAGSDLPTSGGDGRVDQRPGPAGFHGRQARIFQDTKEFCGSEPKSEFAVNEGLPADSSDVAIARQYASEWPPKLRRAAFKGCLAGLATAPARFPSSSPLARDIWGRTFIVTSVTGKGSGEPPIAEPIDIRLTFSAEREHAVSWSAHCNDYGADVHITATAMEVEPSGSTLIGCESAFEEEDDWLAKFLEADPEWRLEGERLQLISNRATIELTDSEGPAN